MIDLFYSDKHPSLDYRDLMCMCTICWNGIILALTKQKCRLTHTHTHAHTLTLTLTLTHRHTHTQRHTNGGEGVRRKERKEKKEMKRAEERRVDKEYRYRSALQ